jgi:hypothetical protein
MIEESDISDPLMIPCFINGEELDFMLDTGASVTTLTRSVASALGIKGTGRLVEIDTFIAGNQKTEKIEFDISVNGAPIQHIKGEMPVNPRLEMRLISWSDLTTHWDVNITRNGISLAKASAGANPRTRTDKNDFAFPITIDSVVNGKPVTWMLDTGADTPVMSEKTVHDLGLEIQSTDLFGEKFKYVEFDVSIKNAPFQHMKARIVSGNTFNAITWRALTEHWDLTLSNRFGIMFRPAGSKWSTLLILASAVVLLLNETELKRFISHLKW